MDAVRAKFTVCEITSFNWSETTKKVLLRPVYDNSIPEDRRFNKATPSGEFWMQVDNPAALESLKLGQVFYIDMIPVPA